MAEVVSTFDWASVQQRGPKRKYAQYLDGQVWRLKPEDMPVDAENVRSAIYSDAKKHGLRVKSVIQNGDLILQAFPREENGYGGDFS